jgi:predicted outer membrane lipoprotein
MIVAIGQSTTAAYGNINALRSELTEAQHRPA